MSNPFAAPQPMTGFPLEDLEGALLIIEATEKVEDINTIHGVQWAVKATVTVVDGDLAGEEYVDTLIFPRVLKNSVAPKIGKEPVLGRLAKGKASKKGYNPPWVLEDPTEADIKAAMKVWESRTPF